MIDLRPDGKEYRTGAITRLIAKERRDDLRSRGLCINGETHGAIVRSSRCERCAVQLERSR